MRRLMLLGTSAICTVVATFLGATYAFGSDGSDPQLPPNLPAAALPVTGMSDAEALEIANGIGAAGLDQFGITAESFKAARTLGQTSAGPLYLIPGNVGSCLALIPAAACGYPGQKDAILALVVTDPATRKAVGGGAVTDDVGAVRVSSQTRVVTARVAGGAFMIRNADGIELSGYPLRFVELKTR